MWTIYLPVATPVGGPYHVAMACWNPAKEWLNESITIELQEQKLAKIDKETTMLISTWKWTLGAILYNAQDEQAPYFLGCIYR